MYNRVESEFKKESIYNKMSKFLFKRYMIVVIIFFVTLKFRLGNVLMEFVGVMGLKAAAYLQPFIHRVMYGSEGEEKPSENSTVI